MGGQSYKYGYLGYEIAGMCYKLWCRQVECIKPFYKCLSIIKYKLVNLLFGIKI